MIMLLPVAPSVAAPKRGAASPQRTARSREFASMIVDDEAARAHDGLLPVVRRRPRRLCRQQRARALEMLDRDHGLDVILLDAPCRMRRAKPSCPASARDPAHAHPLLLGKRSIRRRGEGGRSRAEAVTGAELLLAIRQPVARVGQTA